MHKMLGESNVVPKMRNYVYNSANRAEMKNKMRVEG